MHNGRMCIDSLSNVLPVLMIYLSARRLQECSPSDWTSCSDGLKSEQIVDRKVSVFKCKKTDSLVFSVVHIIP